MKKLFVLTLLVCCFANAEKPAQKPNPRSLCEERLKAIGREYGFAATGLLYRNQNGNVFTSYTQYMNSEAKTASAIRTAEQSLEILTYDKRRYSEKEFIKALQDPEKTPSYIAINGDIGLGDSHMDFFGVPVKSTLQLNASCEMTELDELLTKCKTENSTDCAQLPKLTKYKAGLPAQIQYRSPSRPKKAGTEN